MMIAQDLKHESLSLTATMPSGSTQRYDLQPGQGLFAGTSSNCGLKLAGPDIADIQCHIAFQDGAVWVQNWLSAEGTRINGANISARTQVHVGDVIEIGRYRIAVNSRNSPPPDSKADLPEQELEPTDIADDEEIEMECGDQDFCDVHEMDAMNLITEPEDFDAPLEFDDDPFVFEEEETYDRETVALLRAEIEDLQAALAQRDAEQSFESPKHSEVDIHTADESDEVLQRMQELIEEANRSDERVALLEEMLHVSEVANRSEHDERLQLEAWVGDIEQRIGQREDEHRAELEAIRDRLEQSETEKQRLQKQLQQAAFGGHAPKQYEQTLEKLQSQNKSLQQQLAEAEKDSKALELKLQHASSEENNALREERAKIAQEQAQVSRMRYELSSKLSEIEEMPKEENQADKETAHRIQTLRQHLREIHEQEMQEAREAPLTTRLAKLWKRVEY